jgi:urease accessory protein UreH
MDANFAAQSQRLVLAENAYLELLPGPTIPHRHSRFITHTQATVADGATLLSPGADIAGECIAGASRLPNDAGLVYKVLGMETEPVKSKVRAFWDLVRQAVVGAPIPAARPWGPPPLSATAGY